MSRVPALLFGGASSGSGKTTVVCGVLRALQKRGLKVSAFKCGPDYIDPMFHKRVIGIPSKNLDSFFCNDELLKYIYLNSTQNSQINIVEGVMGYYDGMSMNSADGSSYHIAKLLKIPSILVINAKGTAMTLSALIDGILKFRADNTIKGVILNNISPATYEKIKPVVEKNTGTKVVGFMPHSEDFAIESRHLGLVTPDTIEDVEKKIELLGEIAERSIDISYLLEIAKSVGNLTSSYVDVEKRERCVKVAVAYDDAFCFYYEDNISLLKRLGCEIVEFSPLKDKELPPNIDGLILGGGYPELYCETLSANKSMLKSIKNAVDSNMPILAECGGFMYLQEYMEDKKHNSFKMVGAIEGKSEYKGKLVRFGYVTLSSKLFNNDIKAHEFHYWDSTNNGDNFVAVKNNGTKWNCMHIKNNLICGYPHIFYYSNTDFAKYFVSKCVKYSVER